MSILETNFYTQLGNISTYISESGTELDVPLLESVTYYNLRQFLTLLHKNSNDSDLNKLIVNLLKVLAKLEIRNMPIPTIKKLSSVSPEIFPS